MFSNIFKRLLNIGTRLSLYKVDMITSKYCKFGYASMCENIKKRVLQLTLRYFVPHTPLLHNP